MKYLLALCFLIIGISVSDAQIKDSIQYYLKQEPSLFAAFNNRTSIVDGKNARITGIKGGLDYEEKLRIYASFSWMAVPTTEQKILNAHTQFADTQVHRQHMNFFSLGAEYTWFRNDRWKMTAPIQIGFGTATLDKYTDQNFLLSSKTQVIMPIEIGANASYYFTDWLTATAGIGNRFALLNLKDSQLSGPYYKLGVGVLIGVIYRKVFPKD